MPSTITPCRSRPTRRRVGRGVFHTVFEQLRAATGQDCVDIAVFWQQVQPLIGGARSQAGTVLRRLQEHWADILQIDGDARRLEYTSAALGEQVRRVFAAGAPAWNSARYHCPTSCWRAGTSTAWSGATTSW